MGNPLACAVAAASLELLLKGPWQVRVRSIEQQLSRGLEPLKRSPAVKDVRVLGAIGVVEMQQNVNVPRAQKLLADHGVWLRPFGKLLYTMPPFVIKPNELARIVNGMAAVVLDAEANMMPK
jgi:adenosylmethionine-8-amino-7-oxononanoate aminotransferase